MNIMEKSDKVKLSDLKYEKRWVGWRYILKNNKMRKRPIGEGGYFIDITRHNNLITYDETISLEQLDGIGIVLGDLNNGYYLCGIDLDSCLDLDGMPAVFAYDVLKQFPQSYSEISPSGTGVKLFFLVRAEDIPKIRTALGRDGKQWKKPGGGDHGPAIELYLAGRYFTVTGQEFQLSAGNLGIASVAALLWLIREYGPTFAEVPYDGGGVVDEWPDQDGLRAPAGADVRGVASRVPAERIAARNDWLGFGCALKAALPENIEDARDIFLDMSFGDRDYNSYVFDTLTPPFRGGWQHLERLAIPSDARDAFDADGKPPPTSLTAGG